MAGIMGLFAAELTKELCKAQRVTFAGRGGAWGWTARNAGHQIANGTLRQTYAHARHADTRTDR